MTVIFWQTGQTFSIHDGTFLTELQQREDTQHDHTLHVVAGAGGGYDPHDSDESDSDHKHSPKYRPADSAALFPRKKSPTKKGPPSRSSSTSDGLVCH